MEVQNLSCRLTTSKAVVVSLAYNLLDVEVLFTILIDLVWALHWIPFLHNFVYLPRLGVCTLGALHVVPFVVVLSCINVYFVTI